jgi:hypothetical protein
LYGISSYQPKKKLKKALPRAPTDEGETGNLEHHAHSFGNSSLSCLKFKINYMFIYCLDHPKIKQASSIYGCGVAVV